MGLNVTRGILLVLFKVQTGCKDHDQQTTKFIASRQRVHIYLNDAFNDFIIYHMSCEKLLIFIKASVFNL